MYRHVECYTHYNRIGVLLELETIDDITGRTSEFRALARDLAMHIAACAPDGIEPLEDPQVRAFWPDLDAEGGGCETLLTQHFVKDTERTVEQIIRAVETRLQAEIRVVRFTRYSVEDN